VNVSQRISHVSQQRVQLLANQIGRVLPRRNANCVSAEFQSGDRSALDFCSVPTQGAFLSMSIGPYVEAREQSTWIKILNRNYSQKLGKEELFERDRQEPTPGWHRCVAACAEV
jgi:hypothetical protein